MRKAFLLWGRKEKVCSAKLNRASLNSVRCSPIPLLLSRVEKSGLFLGVLASPQRPTGILPAVSCKSQILQGVCNIQTPETYFPSYVPIPMTIFIICKYFFLYNFMCVCVSAYSIQINFSSASRSPSLIAEQPVSLYADIVSHTFFVCI